MRTSSFEINPFELKSNLKYFIIKRSLHVKNQLHFLVETTVIDFHETLNKLFFLYEIFVLFFSKNIEKAITYNPRKFCIFKKTNVVNERFWIMLLFWTNTSVCYILKDGLEVHNCDILFERNINFSIQILYKNELFWATSYRKGRNICGPCLRFYQRRSFSCLWNFILNLARISVPELCHIEHV